MSAAAAAADPFFHHGGRVSAAAALFPSAPLPWLDLSTGISPWAYPVADLPQNNWQDLPSPEGLRALETAAAQVFGGVSPDQIVAVPGADIAIRLLAVLLEGNSVSIAGPTYGGYQAAWPNARTLPLEKAYGGDIFICANPNNPDGTVIPKEQLQRMRNTRIVDEAFADAMPENSMLPHRNGAIVLRSFGKFFGLAGVRLGFVIADKPMAGRLRALLGDWPISGPAIVIGAKAYRDTVWQEKQRIRLKDAAARLAGLLANNGLEIAGATPLFLLARHPLAYALFNHLARSGILVRPFAERLDWLRFGIPGTDAEFDRLATVLKDWKPQ